jgi:hypothetical protein
MSADSIESKLTRSLEIADIDGNGSVDPLSDGLLLLRHLFGMSGDDLVRGVVHPDGSRQSAAEISGYINSLSATVDTDNDQIFGDWRLAPEAGAVGVGGSQGDTGWLAGRTRW